MKRSISIILPVLVLILAVAGAQLIKANKPAPDSRPPVQSIAAVDATRLTPSAYPVVIRSQGTVQPTTTNALVPEVAGTVVELSDAFVLGGEFVAGEVLVEIDRRDYEIALTQAQANLAQANAQLQEQAALAERASAEWASLGRRGTPSSLTLREPQLAAARASRDAAQAQLEKAQLDLRRTRIEAPYDGIVSERLIDRGQFVSRGSPIGRIHTMDTVDVRLSLSSRQLTYLTVSTDTNVELSATIGNAQRLWTGKLVRTEGLDAATQQLNVIARVRDPYADATSPLRVGQFVQAKIAGQVLQDVFVIPRSALREEREVLLINDQNEIERRAVLVAWSDEQLAAVSEGLAENEILVTTPLSTVANGTPVRATIDGVAPAPLEGKTLDGRSADGRTSDGDASGGRHSADTNADTEESDSGKGQSRLN